MSSEELSAIIDASEEVVYTGKTEVEDYRHRYTLKGRMPDLDLRTGADGIYEMDFENGKAEFQEANKYRSILRTTAKIEELLSGQENNYFS